MPMLDVGMDGKQKVEIYYEDHGSGKPVVLIHGWPLSGRSWEAQIGPLVNAGFRVITYDRRGFGWSSQPWNGYEYDTFASDLNQLLNHLDLKEVTLVGFSMGGGEVARYVSTYGAERIAKAVFAGAVPPFLHKGPNNPDGALDDQTIAGFKKAAITDRIAFLDEFTTGFFSTKGKLMVSEAQRKYAHNIASFASPKGTLDCIHAFSTTDFRQDLAKFKLPTLIIHGDSDSIVPFEKSGKLTHQIIPDSQVVLIKDGPHGFNLSHAEEFNAGLLNLLKS